MIHFLGAALRQMFSDVFPLYGFSQEISDWPSASNTRVLYKLALHKEAGMNGHDVEKLGFPFYISELPRSADLPR